MTPIQLREKRAAKYAELTALDHINGGDEARSRFDLLETEVRALDVSIGRAARAAELEKQAPATPLGNSMPDLASAIDQFNTPAFIAHISGVTGGANVARELEIVQHFQNRNGGEGYAVPLAALLPRLERRALLYSGGSGSGAGLVFEQELPDAITALRANSIVGTLGARMLSGLTGGPVSISKITTGKTATFIAEDSAGTPSDPSTDKVELQSKTAIALLSLSRNLLVQSSQAAQELVSSDLTASIFGAIDRVAIEGGGSNEPSGVWDTVTPTALGEPTWADILEMIEAIEIANVPGARLGWAMHPSAVRVLRSTPKTLFGSPPVAGQGGYIMDAARVCADYAAATSTNVPTTGSPPSAAGIIFGDWSQLVVGIWDTVQLLSNPYSEAEFRRGNVAVRAIASVDVALRYEEAFAARTVAI